MKYHYYALNTERDEIHEGEVAAPDVDSAIKAAATELEKLDIDYADIDVIEDE